MLCWSVPKLQSLQSGKGRTLKVRILHGFYIFRFKELNKTIIASGITTGGSSVEFTDIYDTHEWQWEGTCSHWTFWSVVVNKERNYTLLQLSSKALRFRWLILNMYGAGITFFTRGTEHLGDHKVVTSFDIPLFSIASFTVGIFLQKHLTSLAFSRSLVYWDFWTFIIHFKSAFKIQAGTALTADFCSAFLSMGPFI